MKNKKLINSSDILQESSIQAFFFDRLHEINQKSEYPVSTEALFYTSKVLDVYSCPTKCFDEEDGKKFNKVLGIKLLESEKLSKSKRRKTLMDVGDTALVICGFFYESLNRKLFNIKHYHDVGKSAYSKLNVISPKRNDLSIYGLMVHSFDRLANMISIISDKSFNSMDKYDTSVVFMIQDQDKIKAS